MTLATEASPPTGAAQSAAVFARSGPPRLEALRAALVALVAGCIAFVRIPEELRDTLWAEDGTLFLADALWGRAGLLTPYAGYLHLASRAAAAVVAALVPPQHAAVACTALASAWNGLAAGVVYYASRDAFAERAPRLFVAASTVLLPLMPVEVAGNLANLHGFFVWSAFWVLWGRPRTRLEAAGYCAWMLVAALSEVQTIALVPLALLLAWQRRSWSERSVIAALLVGVLAELWAITHSVRPGDQKGLPPLGPLLAQYGKEVALPMWLVDTARLNTLQAALGPAVLLLATLPLLVAAGLVIAYGDRRARWLALVSAGLSTGLFALAHAMNYGLCMHEAACLGTIRILNRYGPIPSLFALVPVALLAQVALQRRRLFLSIAAGAVALPLVGTAIANFEVGENRRYAAHAWRPQLAASRATCAGEARPSEVCLAISPRRWKACVPCAYLLAQPALPSP
jgi:branched-subunit amino acid transport protein AzlD